MGPKRCKRSTSTQVVDSEMTPQCSTIQPQNISFQGKPSNFIINVAPYHGDPQLLDHFFYQINELTQINSWTQRQGMLFLKSKLDGEA